MPSSDLIVIGLGAMGSAALYQSAKLGARVLGIDRFVPPHDRGSSHGDSRITREAIGEGREFVPLAQRSNQIWEELEAATGRSLLTRNGCLILAPANLVSNHHGSKSFLQDTLQAAREFRIPHEQLTTADIRRRFPQFRLHGDESGYFESGAGFLRPEVCVETQLMVARQLGARVLTSETVLALRQTKDGTVEVRSTKGTYSAARAIVTPGPWIAELLGTEYGRYFKVYRQVPCWFALARNVERYTPENFPVFIWIVGNQPRDMMYGFPAIDGPDGGLKIATEQYAGTVDPDTVNRTVNDTEVTDMYAEYVGPRFPDISGRCLRAQACLYTVTPDAKFIVDRCFGCENILFASACSGHGFKHSAALGEALAREILGLPPAIQLSPFKLDRFLDESHRQPRKQDSSGPLFSEES